MTGVWCEPDGCPSSVCGGPHHEVQTALGTETLRADQQPVGSPQTPPSMCEVCAFPPYVAPGVLHVCEPLRTDPSQSQRE